MFCVWYISSIFGIWKLSGYTSDVLVPTRCFYNFYCQKLYYFSKTQNLCGCAIDKQLKHGKTSLKLIKRCCFSWLLGKILCHGSSCKALFVWSGIIRKFLICLYKIKIKTDWGTLMKLWTFLKQHIKI